MKGLFQCPPWAAPWVIMDASLSPCKGKSFKRIRQFTKLLPLQGALLIAIIPRAMPREGTEKVPSWVMLV